MIATAANDPDQWGGNNINYNLCLWCFDLANVILFANDPCHEWQFGMWAGKQHQCSDMNILPCFLFVQVAWPQRLDMTECWTGSRWNPGAKLPEVNMQLCLVWALSSPITWAWLSNFYLLWRKAWFQNLFLHNRKNDFKFRCKCDWSKLMRTRSILLHHFRQARESSMVAPVMLPQMSQKKNKLNVLMHDLLFISGFDLVFIFFSSQDPETNYFWKLLHNHVPVVVQSSFSESKSFFRFHMQVVLPGQSLELSVDVTLLPRRMTTFGHLNHFFLIFTQPSSLWSFASGKHTTVPICRQTHSSQSDKWLQTNSQCIQATACSPAAWQSRTRLTAILVVLESEGQVDPQSPKLELA